MQIPTTNVAFLHAETETLFADKKITLKQLVSYENHPVEIKKTPVCFGFVLLSVVLQFLRLVGSALRCTGE